MQFRWGVLVRNHLATLDVSRNVSRSQENQFVTSTPWFEREDGTRRIPGTIVTASGGDQELALNQPK